jgi:TAG lipase/steryl ester hydrolase/phospholipase A2/LPA acyltransferase
VASSILSNLLNIVVSPASGSGNKDSLRLLNYLTAPNVLVWSASLASCA